MFLSIFCLHLSSSASADPMLEKLDEQLVTSFRHSTISFQVETPRRNREYLLEQWSDEQRSSVLITAPTRHKGTKLLRHGQELWTRLPQIRSVERVSGHLLRRPVLGSDLSFNDLLSSPRLSKEYNVLEKRDVSCPAPVNSQCIELLLSSIDPNHSYPRRNITVLAEPMSMLSDERYSQSEKLIKRFSYSDHRIIDGHNLPFLIQVNQHASKSTTTLRIRSIELTKSVATTPQLQHRWLEQ